MNIIILTFFNHLEMQKPMLAHRPFKHNSGWSWLCVDSLSIWWLWPSHILLRGMGLWWRVSGLTRSTPGFAKEGHFSRHKVFFIPFLSKEKSRVCWVNTVMPLAPHFPGVSRGSSYALNGPWGQWLWRGLQCPVRSWQLASASARIGQPSCGHCGQS